MMRPVGDSMKLMNLVLSFALVCLLLACGRSSVPSGGQAPNQNPEGNGPGNQNPVRASLTVGNVQRNFTPEDSVSCSVNETFSEGVVIFNNVASGSSFSVRMQNVSTNKSTRWLVSRNTGENIMVTLGGDANQNNYQMARDDAGNNCWVSTEINQGYFSGTFQCQQLINRQSGVQAVSGSWFCRLQTNKDWNW